MGTLPRRRDLVMALLRFVNPLLQPEDVPRKYGTLLVAHTLRCRVIHELPHLLLAALHAR